MAEAAVKTQFIEDAGASDLGAPLYVAWQITNECNLACLHCIEESGPGKAFKDELSKDEAFAVIDQLIASEVPYVSFSGGEPMVHPHFFEMVSRLAGSGVGLKIDTNGHYPTPEHCKRLKDLGVKAVQVSIHVATPPTFNKMRVHGRRDRAGSIDRLPGGRSRVNCSAKFSIHEIGEAVDRLPHGRLRFYTGKIMYGQRRAYLASRLRRAVRAIFQALHAKPRYRAACACTTTRWACSTSCATAC